MMKKINKKILFIAVVVLLLLAFVFIVLFTQEQKRVQKEEEEEKASYLIPRENVSPENWRRQLELEGSENKNLIKNIYDGYQIELGEGWIHDDKADPVGGFTAYKFKDEVETDVFRDLSDGVLLAIHAVENPEKMSTVDWLSRSNKPANYLLNGLTFQRVDHPNESGVYRSSHRVFEIEAGESHEHAHTEDASGNPMNAFVGNSSKVDYVFSHKDMVYVVSCSSMAEAYAGLVHQCEQQIQTFEILE